jgi:hypothetical protein
MKKILLSAILVAFFISITSFRVHAQTQYYVQVTIYYNSRQYVQVYLWQMNSSTRQPTGYTQDYLFNPSEGQAVDGGYIYQKWILLSNYWWPMGVSSCFMRAFLNDQRVDSGNYTYNDWPYNLAMTAIDKRYVPGQ